MYMHVCVCRYFLGYGQRAVQAIRRLKILDAKNKVPRSMRVNKPSIVRLRERLIHSCVAEKTIEYTFSARDFGKRYNGAGFRGTGGPKTDWLAKARGQRVSR